ncbi:hypothetical protein ACP70R_000769 [Stipagrostis hirtigluma subsp. patula]
MGLESSERGVAPAVVRVRRAALRLQISSLRAAWRPSALTADEGRGRGTLGGVLSSSLMDLPQRFKAGRTQQARCGYGDACYIVWKKRMASPVY